MVSHPTLRRSLGALLTLVAIGGGASTVLAQDAEIELTPVDPLPLSIRFGGGLAIPYGDAANENPDLGWVGAQGPGYSARVGVRVPFMDTAYFRPEVSFQRYGEHDGTVDVLVNDGVDIYRDTASHHMESTMVAFRVYLEYIPLAGSGLDVFLAGGLGLAHVGYERTLSLDGDPFTQDEGELSGSLAIEVGVRVRGLELTLSSDFQSPRYVDGTPSWNTAHLYLAYLLPLR